MFVSSRRILVVFFLSHYLNLIDENRLALKHMISSLLYEETFVFPVEFVCVELTYLIISIAFEVRLLIAVDPSIIPIRLELLPDAVRCYAGQAAPSPTCSQM